MKIENPQVKKVNAAFGRVNKAITRYLKECATLGAPVKSLSVRTFVDGTHAKTSIRYFN